MLHKLILRFIILGLRDQIFTAEISDLNLARKLFMEDLKLLAALPFSSFNSLDNFPLLGAETIFKSLHC